MPPFWKLKNSRRIADGEFQIPRHLFFLWGFLGDGVPLPEREQRIHDLWCSLNPDWTVEIRSPESVESAISGHSHQAPYCDLSKGIQRCDVARPFLLEKFGGVYSDLDVYPRQNLDLLCGMFPHARVLLLEEVTLTHASSIRRGNRFPIRQGRPELRLRVANFWMASVPGHPFWQDVLDLMKERSHLEVRDDYDVIYTTGPDIISEVYDHTAEKYDDVALVPRRIARRFLRHNAHASWRAGDNNTG